MTEITKRRIPAVCLLLFLLAAAPAAADEKNRQVLILAGTQYGLPVIEAVTGEIIRTLQDDGWSLDDIFVEFLDLQRIPDPQYRLDVSAFLEKKLDKAGAQIPMIIALNQGAVDFLALEGKHLYPEAPLLIPLYTREISWAYESRDIITLEPIQDVAGTLDQARRLFPEFTRLTVIAGRDDSSAPFINELFEAASRMDEPFEIETTREMTYEQMLEYVSLLPEDSVVLYGSYFHDVTGRSFVPVEVAREVSRRSSAPVFGLRDVQILEGLLGGSVVRTPEIGRKTAEVLEAYLRGDIEIDRHVRFDVPEQALYDWQQLKRFSADPRLLPHDAVFFNRPATIWDAHRDMVIITGVLLGILAVLAGALYLKNRRLTAAVRMQHQAEAGQRRSDELFRHFAESVPVGMVIIGINQQVIFLNNQFTEIFGYTREDISDIAQWWTSAYPDAAYRSEIRTAWENRNRRPGPFEAEVRCLDGTRRLVEFRWADTEEFSFILMSDMTERRKLEEQLRQSQKMDSVGRLAGGIAHDFNNMLGVIIGRAELAEIALGQEHPVLVELKEIMRAASYSADLTRQLLAFSRQQVASPKLIDLSKTVESSLKMVTRLIGEHIDLQWFPGKNLPPVKIDPTQIHQILTNLCINSRNAVGDSGKITVETKKTVIDEEYCRNNLGFYPGEYLILSVSDDGCGMDSETQEHMFEPFFTTKEVGKGTGLGLPTVYGIVKQNNGFINVYSEPGRGTAVRIYLPRAHGTPRSTAGEYGALTKKKTGRRLSILLVEDNRDMRKMVAQMLEQIGHSVTAADRPEEAAAAADRMERLDLLVTDVVMPGINGRQLSRQLEEKYSGLKTLFMSGYTANVIVHHGILDEGVHFIQKPFSLQEAADALEEIFASPSPDDSW